MGSARSLCTSFVAKNKCIDRNNACDDTFDSNEIQCCCDVCALKVDAVSIRKSGKSQQMKMQNQ